MSALAYNLSGDPFELPASATGYRVKRIKGKGPPELVYGADGLPLTVPLEADIDDLRRELRQADGKYRLDPIDENGRAVAACPAAYVVIHPAERPAEPAPPVSRPTHAAIDLVVAELIRANGETMARTAELSRTVVEKFSLMVESVAGLVRAADGAGLPAREPRGAVQIASDDNDDDEDEDQDQDQEDSEDDAESAEAATWPALIDKGLNHVLPWLNAAIASGKLKLPGGAGALLDHRDDTAARARPTSTTGAVPAPGPSDPAPAKRRAPPSTAASSGSASGTTRQAAGSAPAVAPRDRASSVDPAAAADATLATKRVTQSASGTVAGLPADLPTLDIAGLARLAAVREGLTLEEQMLAHELITNRFTPAELRAFLADLQAMSIPEAIAEVRAVLGLETDGAADSATASDGGGAS